MWAPQIDLPPDLTPTQICQALPGQSVPADTPQGRLLRRTIMRGLIHLTVRELVLSAKRGYRGRSTTDVAEFYNQGSASKPLAVPTSAPKCYRRISYRIGEEFVVSMTTVDAKNFAIQRIANVVAILKPATLCEIGSGIGRNLFYLASQFPGLQCSGYELAARRVAISREMQNADLTETEFGRQHHIKADGIDNVRRIKFIEASAYALPIPDRCYDLVLTFAALEQMERGQDKALSEIRRIARQYVLMYEPLADVNSPIQRAYLWSRNYFRMPTNRLRDHGLEPIKVWKGFPHKPTFGYGLVLCRPI